MRKITKTIYRETLNRLLESHGKSQKDVGEALGMDRTFISKKFINGAAVACFDPPAVFALAHAIGCSVNELLAVPENKPSESAPETKQSDPTSSVSATLLQMDLMRKEINANFDNLYQEVRGLREDIRELAKAQHTDLMQIYKILAMPQGKPTVTATGKIIR
ncbi:MAG: helix-turn-helix transcriptional regulator [Lachnospiraceae bacterium]|nr:helix-turn-helix transcriptional regulator [Lachnospiraceae bacterium]